MEERLRWQEEKIKALERKLEEVGSHARSQYDISLKLLENVRDFRRDVMDWLKGMSRVRPVESAPEYREEEEATPTEEELRELGIPEEYIEEE